MSFREGLRTGYREGRDAARAKVPFWRAVIEAIKAARKDAKK